MNEVFKYGDEKKLNHATIKFLPTNKESTFEIKGYSDYYTKEKGWKVISPVFKTEDNKDIFEGETIYWCYQGVIYELKCTTDNSFSFYPERNLIYFSNKELAMLHYLENNGFFSIKDIMGEVAMAQKYGSLDISLLYNSLLKLTQSK